MVVCDDYDVNSADAVISSVMSAVHSLPDSPSYAAIYTSSYTHLPDTFYDYREIRSVDEKLTVYRQRRESEDVEDVEDVAFDNSPICASVSWVYTCTMQPIIKGTL